MKLKLSESLLVALTLFFFGNAAAQGYRLVDLGTLAQGNAAVVRGPNGSGVGVGGGHVVGARSASGPRHGLLFESGTARLVPGFAGSDDTVVFGLNDAGILVGSSNMASNVRAFTGTPTGVSRELPPLGGDTASAAFAVNNLGQAAGFSSGAAGQRAVMWDANGTPRALAAVAGMSSSRASGLNDRGDISGVIGTAAGPRPVLWPAGQNPTVLMLLAGHAAGEASSINARGDVVGYSADPAGKRRATVWPWLGGAVNLGTLPGGDFSQAFASNAAGEIVGTSTSGVGSRAVLWLRNGAPQDLNTLAPSSAVVLTKAVGINDAGMILATGHDLPPGATAGDHSHEDVHEFPLRVFLLIRSGGTQ